MKTITVYELRTPWELTRGLVGREHFRAVSFKTRWGIHTFLLKTPITVLILDGNDMIQYIKVVKPNRIFMWNPRYSHVVEVVGTHTNYKLGDRITLVNR